jgi:hypothetical protein
MVAIKLGSINDIVYSMKELVEKDLQIKVAYKLSKLLKILDNENQTFEEQRIKLFQKYGVKDENGNLKTYEGDKINIAKDNLKLFNTEFKELCNIEINIDFEPIKLDDLGDIKLKTLTLYGLSDFIVE